MSTTRLPAGRVYPDIQGLKKPSRLIPIRPCLRDSGRGHRLLTRSSINSPWRLFEVEMKE